MQCVGSMQPMKTPFEVIPVLDVRHGVAVRAVAGDRANYQPLVTPLSASANPVDLVDGYSRLFPFSMIYVADLDGIEGRGGNANLLAELSAARPGLKLWVDNGSSRFADVGELLENSRTTAVIGSESNLELSELQRLIDLFGDRIVLSLDFDGGDFRGANNLLADASHWPRRVIVMTLARVGTNGGPDAERVAEIAGRAGPHRRIFTAGGVRNLADLRAVQAAGAAGALIASALHNGQIKTGDLEEIAGSERG